MIIENMTWKEIEDKLKQTQTILVPISPLEQHGLHLPISTDYDRAYEVAKRAAKQTNVFCIPPIILGNNKKGYAFPGTISVRPETLKNIIIDVCTSLRYTGFKKIIIVSGHWGTKHVESINKALEELDDKDILFVGVHKLVDEKIIKEIIETENDRHAGESETSDMLYLEEEQVQMDKAVASFPKYPEEDVDYKEYKKINPTGITGDPTKATKEKGKIMIEEAIKNLVKLIKQ